MAGALESPSRDGLVTFLPHRLNRHPVVVRGLTADELWVCAGLSGAVGFVAGVPLAWLTHSNAGRATRPCADWPVRCAALRGIWRPCGGHIRFPAP